MAFAELRALFDDPPRDFSPTPLWWWSGGQVTRQRIRWQMERFVSGGVHNLVVINLAPAGPIVGARPDDPAWFSEQWWDRFAYTCEVARELGMKIWFYDQIGFSGANVQGSITLDHPEAAGWSLRLREGLPEAGEQVIAAFDTDGRRVEGPLTRLTRPMRLVTAVPTAFDYLDPHAVRLLIDRIHGEFERRVPEYLGTVIAGSFQDELPATNSWTAEFAKEFATRKGYDLTEHLLALWETGETDAGDERAAKIRGDYYAVRAELTEEALFRPLGQWHSERGMLIGADQSNPARAGNPAQGTQIYTDYFRTHRWYGAAGSDHEGDAKVHSSMAHLYGHERVWIESFHSSGWGGTLEDTYDWLLPFLRSGANLYNPHASYFGTAAGWFEWAPPSTDWRQPYWAQYPAFSRAVARIASIMSWGRYEADVAVLHPTATAQAHLTLDVPVDHFGDGATGVDEVDRAQRDYLALCGSNNWFVTAPGVLDEAGIAFDVIDDASVQRAETADGVLSVAGPAYSAVILPSASVLEEETARRLHSFVERGGLLVVVGRPPSTAAGRSGDDAVVRALAADPRVLQTDGAGGAVEALPRGYAASDVPLLVRRAGDEAVALVTGAFPNASGYPLRTDTWLWEDYDFDPARYAQVKTVAVAAGIAEAEVWNPATGERRAAEVTRRGDASEITVRLDGAPAVLVVWREGAPGDLGPDRPDQPDQPPADISEGWTGELHPTMDNTWGDMALPAGASVTELQIWTMEWAEGAPANWSPSRATFGERVRTLPAASAPLTPAEAEDVLAGQRPLADDAWATHVYSRSRGVEKDTGMLGNKGLVAEEFVKVEEPRPGAAASVRALVRSDRTGQADLVVACGAAKRVWWNGAEATAGDGYASVSPVQVRDVNVLEYHLGESENAPSRSLTGAPAVLGSFFTLVEPGGFGARPEFMRTGDGSTYQASFDVPGTVRGARLVVGAATALTVLLDGAVVARQEKVEYYESSWGATPMFFAHDLPRLGSGTHTLQIVTDSADARDVVYADLVVEHDQGVSVLVSGAGWTTGSGVSAEHRGHWKELANAHAAARTHPLRASEWLGGTPVVGSPADDVRATDSVIPAVQWFRTLLPAGAVAVQLPLRTEAVLTVDGLVREPEGGEIRWDTPLQRPAELLVRTSPTLERGGSVWDGPLRVETVPAPVALGDWRDIGLRAWSGAVTYRRTAEIPPGAVLDLGRVRGSVEVTIDGRPIGEAFCAPYRIPLPDVTGTAEIAVTVRNTLAPYLDEATPTTWVFPSQLGSGLFGPVTLTCEAERP